MKKLIGLIPLFLVCLCSLKGYAATKEMSVGLTDEYSMATFYLDFSEEQEYTVTVTSPSGLSHETVISGTSGSVSVADIENGTYKIKITAENEIEVKSRVECKRTEVTENTKDINISNVVSGLKIYFKDKVLCMEWDKNANEEAIDVEVTDPNTMQVLDSVTVRDCFYSLSFDETIKQLVIYLVPAKSSNIQGAGNQFTVDVVLDNMGRVQFPQKTLYNVNEYTFTVNLVPNMRVFVDEDSLDVYDETYKDGGTYDITIPLNDIRNHITVWLEDEKGNLNSFIQIVDRDLDAPVFKIDAFDTVTKESSVTISGSVTETNIVTFNDDFEITTDEYGRFSFDNKLAVGDNTIKLSACDEAGNIKEIEYLVTRKEVNYTPVLIFVVIGVGILLGYGIYKKKSLNPPPKPPKNKPQKEKTKKEEKTNPVKEKPLSITKPTKKVNTSPFNDYLVFMPVVVFALSLIIVFSVGIKNTKVASGSMEPTLKTNNYCFYNRLAYKHHAISRGDIICFNKDNLTMSKRVIGLPGDTISFADGYVIINGVKAEESYLNEDIETNCTKTFEVPEGAVFVLGDNREDSYDSRFWESPYVPIKSIYGKYMGQITKVW